MLYMPNKIIPRDSEVVLDDNDLIVSKTCTKGKITYANRTFMSISGFPEQALLGQPHNLIRHPDMPKSVFRFMWKALQDGNEFFGFVKNLCSDGSYYWVFANVTPDIDQQGRVTGFYSVRRKPKKETVQQIIEPLYKEMLALEASGQGASAMDQSTMVLQKWLGSVEMEYCQAMIHLYQNGKI